MTTVTMIASAFAQALGLSLEKDYNRGFYEGTRIPLRQIPYNSSLTLHEDGTLSDEDGGWIADLFCATTLHGDPRLGVRDTKAVFEYYLTQYHKRATR